MTHLQFGFSVPCEYVHNYAVSAMMCYKIECSVPGWCDQVRIFFLYLIGNCIIRRVSL